MWAKEISSSDDQTPVIAKKDTAPHGLIQARLSLIGVAAPLCETLGVHDTAVHRLDDCQQTFGFLLHVLDKLRIKLLGFCMACMRVV